MTKIYATLDSDGDRIQKGACILAFDNIEAARDWARNAIETDDDHVVRLVPGEWGDCWYRDTKAPRVAERAYAPFSYTQLSIQRPGSHPGGRFWWVTPRPDVLVLLVIDAEDA